MNGIHINSNLEWETMVNLCDPKTIYNSPYGPYFFHAFDFWQENSLIYFSGYSKEKAAGCAQYMFCEHNIEHLFVIGTSGGVDPRLALLDVIIANETVIYDCIDRLEYETCLFPEDFRTLIDICHLENKVLPEKTWIGRIATADQDIDASVRNLLMPHGVLVADWESGAIALIAKLNKVPITILRGVSDLPEKGLSQEAQAKQYRSNTPKLMARLVKEYLPLFSAHQD